MQEVAPRLLAPMSGIQQVQLPAGRLYKAQPTVASSNLHAQNDIDCQRPYASPGQACVMEHVLASLYCNVTCITARLVHTQS